MPNPEILEFSENHRNPDFHGNSVNSSENYKISENPTFYAVSASQGTYEKHRKSLVFLRLASAGTVEVLQREEMWFWGQISLNQVDLMEFPHFCFKCHFRGPGAQRLMKPKVF